MRQWLVSLPTSLDKVYEQVVRVRTNLAFSFESKKKLSISDAFVVLVKDVDASLGVSFSYVTFQKRRPREIPILQRRRHI